MEQMNEWEKKKMMNMVDDDADDLEKKERLWNSAR